MQMPRFTEVQCSVCGNQFSGWEPVSSLFELEMLPIVKPSKRAEITLGRQRIGSTLLFQLVQLNNITIII